MKTKVQIYNEMSYTVYYEGHYCMHFDSMKKAIKMATDNFKNNGDMAGDYSIYIEGEGVKTLVASVSKK